MKSSCRCLAQTLSKDKEHHREVTLQSDVVTHARMPRSEERDVYEQAVSFLKGPGARQCTVSDWKFRWMYSMLIQCTFEVLVWIQCLNFKTLRSMDLFLP